MEAEQLHWPAWSETGARLMVFDGSSRGLQRDVRHQKLEALARGLGFVVGLRP